MHGYDQSVLGLTPGAARRRQRGGRRLNGRQTHQVGRLQEVEPEEGASVAKPSMHEVALAEKAEALALAERKAAEADAIAVELQQVRLEMAQEQAARGNVEAMAEAGCAGHAREFASLQQQLETDQAATAEEAGARLELAQELATGARDVPGVAPGRGRRPPGAAAGARQCGGAPGPGAEPCESAGGRAGRGAVLGAGPGGSARAARG
ncbi:unnamed protein product [Prorocentrum cordatum]|uniref:Uncharacterized protein n=1 Tax=Prorocentrum cordatum TaxID=2364126 RepID=A0ABN9VSX6_9DINO|nr:unnamed protein product [Polarella glacialis]